MTSHRGREPDEIGKDKNQGEGQPFAFFPVTPWFFERTHFPRLGQGGLWSPKIDMIDKGDACIITVELPGVEPNDVRISISNNIVTIQGERHTSADIQSAGYHRRERSYGSFRRDVKLPDNLKTDNMEATFEKGELIITFPKTEGVGSERESSSEQ